MTTLDAPRLRLHELQLSGFRSYSRLRLRVEPGLNVFCGPNGSGKTNLLEAIAYLALARSPRTSRDADLLCNGSSDFEVRGLYSLDGAHGEGTERPTSIGVRYRVRGGRQAEINGTPVPTLSSIYGRLLVVFFSPDDLWLLKGAPATRRLLLDRLLVQASPLYADALLRYRQTLAQRNATLHEIRSRRAGRALLAIWDSQLVQYGAELLQRRSDTVAALDRIAAEVYRELAGGGEELRCRYVPGLGAESPGVGSSAWGHRFETVLGQRTEADVAAATTTVGPHRDDLQTEIAGRAASRYASQGQQRSAALALKFAERSYLASLAGRLPLLLVDDVLSELDARRRSALHGLLTGGGQIFLTTADPEADPALASGCLYSVHPGCVTRAATPG